MKLDEMKQSLSEMMTVLQSYDGDDKSAKIAQAETMKSKIEQAESDDAKLKALQVSANQFHPKTVQSVPNIQVGAKFQDDPKKGFKNVGEFLQVLHRSNGNYQLDERLWNIAQTSGVHTTINDGLTIPSEMGNEIFINGADVSDNWLNKINIASTTSNAKEFKRTAANTQGSTTGLTVARIAESGQMTSSRETFAKITAKLEKLYIYSEVTEEDLEDAPFLVNHISTMAPKLLDTKIMQEYLAGTGVGESLGMFNANNSNKIATTRNTASTIKAEDIANMYARHLRGKNSFWLINPAVWANLPIIKIGDTPVFVNNFNEGYSGMLLGLPVYICEDCADLGTIGDIRLINPDGYLGLQKVGGSKFAVDKSVKFDYDRSAFRWTFRVTGLPMFNAVYTPRAGATLSHFVQVAT